MSQMLAENLLVTLHPAGLAHRIENQLRTGSQSLLSQRYSNKISWLALSGICGPGTLSVSS
jgi:hypothetical protein